MKLFEQFFGPLSKDKFARLIKDAIEKAGEKDPIHYDSKDFSLHAKGDGENTLNLGNAYAEYCGASESQKATLLRNFVRTWFSTRKGLPEDFESAAHDLLPAIRNRMMFEHVAMRMKMAEKTGFHWPYQVLAEHLGIGLVYDLPSSMFQIQQHSFDQWGTTFAEAYPMACANLGQITKHILNAVAPGVWESPWQDNYDPSRMLLLDYIRHHNVVGDPVVMIPNRDTLLLTGSQDSAGLAKIVEMATPLHDHPRSLSGSAFRLTEDNEWVPFLPAPAHPESKKYRLLQVKDLWSSYDQQKTALNELHEKMGKDIFVASYSAVEKQDTGEIRSYCVWSEGVVAFLPKTDYVYFFQVRDREEGEIVATVSWAAAADVLGDRIKPVGIYPERYLVEGFPTDEEIAAFGFH